MATKAPLSKKPPQLRGPAKKKPYWNSFSDGWDGYEGMGISEGIGHFAGGLYDTAAAGADYIVDSAVQGAKNDYNRASDIASSTWAGFTGSNKQEAVVPEIAPYVTRQAPPSVLSPPIKNNPAPTAAQIENYGYADPYPTDTVVPAVDKTVDPTVKAETAAVPVLEPLTLPDAAATVVPEKAESVEEVTARVEREYEASKITDTGTDDKSGINTSTFEATDGEGNKIPVPPEQIKGIFDKASSIFGDVFSGPDLKRMTLYTLGGLMSGGSLEGSFKWAGMKVMEEQGISKANQVAADAKTLDYERLVARELTATDEAELTALTLQEFTRLTAEALAGTNATKAQVAALALKNYQELHLNTLRDNSIRQAAATTGAAQLKLNAKNDRVGQPTSTTEGYTAQGIPNIPFLEATQRYGKNDTKYFTVDVPNTLFDTEADGSLIAVELNGFKKWARLPENRHLGINLAKGNNSGNMEVNQLKRIMEISDKLAGTVEKAFDKSDLDSLAASESVAAHLVARGYKIDNIDELVHIRHLTALTANDAAAYSRANGNMIINNMAPFFDKAALSVAAGAPGEGVWGIKHTTRLLGRVSYTSVDTKKVGLLAKTMLDKAGGDFEVVKTEFEKMYKHYNKVKAGEVPGETIPTLTVLDDENEFYVWATKRLAKK